MRSLIVFAIAAVPWAQPADIVGNWQGTPEAGALKLRVGLHVSKSGAGGYISTMDSIGQGSQWNSRAANDILG